MIQFSGPIWEIVNIILVQHDLVEATSIVLVIYWFNMACFPGTVRNVVQVRYRNRVARTEKNLARLIENALWLNFYQTSHP